jgi:hypothetical protein
LLKPEKYHLLSAWTMIVYCETLLFNEGRDVFVVFAVVSAVRAVEAGAPVVEQVAEVAAV